MCYQTAHRLALNPSSGKESNNQSADGCWLVLEISFKCRLMNSEAGCADGRHTLTPWRTDLPRLKVKVCVRLCICVCECVERNWASNGTSKQSNSARDARILRAGPFIRDHQELMKHTERVIKQQTPTTAGLLVWHINHISVCRCLNLLFCYAHACVCVCACTWVCHVCVCFLHADTSYRPVFMHRACLHLLGKSLQHTLRRCYCPFCVLSLNTVHHLCGSALFGTLSFGVNTRGHFLHNHWCLVSIDQIKHGW